MKVKLERLPEPVLLFRNTENTYCKEGLLSCEGPYDAKKESHSNKIILGLIATKELSEKTKERKACFGKFLHSKYYIVRSNKAEPE